MKTNRLIIIAGQEGAGKSTLVRALLPHTPEAARIDAEDLGQTNPCHMDTAFFELLRKNVAMLTCNFWAAGYSTVIAGSFINSLDEYTWFRNLLPKEIDIFLVHLCASKTARDQRRVERSKPSTAAWRDHIDALHPEDTSFQSATDYRYIRVENSGLSIDDTVIAVKRAIPKIYGES